MKTATVAGAMLATAVALAFTGIAVNQRTRRARRPRRRKLSTWARMRAKGRAPCRAAANDCPGKNSCAGKGYIITADARSCEAKGGHVGKKAPMAM